MKNDNAVVALTQLPVREYITIRFARRNKKRIWMGYQALSQETYVNANGTLEVMIFYLCRTILHPRRRVRWKKLLCVKCVRDAIYYLEVHISAGQGLEETTANRVRIKVTWGQIFWCRSLLRHDVSLPVRVNC